MPQMEVPFQGEDGITKLLIEYTLAPREPNVGIMSEYIDDMRVIEPATFSLENVTERELLDIEEYILDHPDFGDTEEE